MGITDKISYGKATELRERRLRRDDPLLNGTYIFDSFLACFDLLSANVPGLHDNTIEAWCNYVFLVSYCRDFALLSVYQSGLPQKQRFRNYITRQRAEQITINRMVGECRDEEWRNEFQKRIQPKDGERRRRIRRQNGIRYSLHPRVFSWGDLSVRHLAPWAPVPRQVRFFNIFTSRNWSKWSYGIRNQRIQNISNVAPWRWWI